MALTELEKTELKAIEQRANLADKLKTLEQLAAGKVLGVYLTFAAEVERDDHKYSYVGEERVVQTFGYSGEKDHVKTADEATLENFGATALKAKIRELRKQLGMSVEDQQAPFVPTSAAAYNQALQQQVGNRF